MIDPFDLSDLKFEAISTMNERMKITIEKLVVERDSGYVGVLGLKIFRGAGNKLH